MARLTSNSFASLEISQAFDQVRERLAPTGWDLRAVDEAEQILACMISQREYDAATKVVQSRTEILKEWRYLEYWYFEGAPLSVQISLLVGLQLKLLIPPVNQTQRIGEFTMFFQDQIAFKTARNRSEVVGGWLFPGEPEMLWESVRRTAKTLGDLCEIGSWVGRSTILLASACAEHSPQKCLHVVDDWSFGGQPDIYPYLTTGRHLKAEFEDNLSPWRSIIKIHYGEFKDVFSGLEQECPQGLALVFHDAGHTPEDFERDLPLITPLINSGGLLLIHDYVSRRFSASREAIDRWINSNPDFVLEKVVGCCALIARK